MSLLRSLMAGIGAWRAGRIVGTVVIAVVWLACSIPAVAAGAQSTPPPVHFKPWVLVSGVPAGSPEVQQIVNRVYRKQSADHAGAMDDAAWQRLLTTIDAALHEAGYTHARAYLSSRMAVFELPDTSIARTDKVPPVIKRDSDNNKPQHVAVRGFVIKGVGEHADAGITPKTIKAMVKSRFVALGGSNTQPALLDFAQLQSVADAITKRYRKAGFIVATAYLPAQKVGYDGRVRIDVLEGRIGRIVVKGAKRYRPWVISAPAQQLRGKVLRKSDLESALLYDRDLPGVSVSSTLQPGEKTGQTDLVMLAREAKRPYAVTTGLSNYGTPVTGRYRAEARLDWFSPLGLGDQLSVGVNYAFMPHQNTYGSLDYTLPFPAVRGMGMKLGASRSELEINNGSFAQLDINGPTSRYFAGLHWKFRNSRTLSMTASLRYVDERSRLETLGYLLSDERFNVAQLGFSMKHTDRRFHGIGVLSVNLRHALRDQSLKPDLVSPGHSRDFTVAQLDFTRVQFLAPTQQMLLKLSGQYTDDALVPMEQFAIGGPSSVRAFPIADGLYDRGFYTALEYHVDAPGFADVPSPFNGVPWRNVLTLEAFVDHARGYAVGANALHGEPMATYSGAGVGLMFRLRHWHDLLFHLDAAVPLGGREATDKSDYHIYGRFDLTF